MSWVVWRRDFIKFPASRSPGWPAERAGLTTEGGRGRCLALTVLREIWLGAGAFWVWWADRWEERRSPDGTPGLRLDQSPKIWGWGGKGQGAPGSQHHPGPSWVEEDSQNFSNTSHGSLSLFHE